MSKSVFISHATKDKEIIDAFVDLILHGALSVSINDIFCVSTDGTKIISGEDWRNSIRSNLLNAKINFLIITPNYKESEVCLNEMGAAWVTSARVLPLIVEPINYKSVGVIQEPKQIEKLLDEGSLDRIKDIVQAELKTPSEKIKSDRWTSKKKEFLLRVSKHIATNPFEIPMDKSAFKQLLKDKADLEKTIEGLIDEKRDLENFTTELKKAKDKDEVKAIIRKNKNASQYDDFQRLCQSISDLLSQQNSLINGIIFKSYSRKEIEIGWEGNKEELDEAIANDHIDEDLEIKWTSTKMMRNIKLVLDKIERFIDSNLGEDFMEEYEGNFESPLDLKNKGFWEEVLEVKIRFK